MRKFILMLSMLFATTVMQLVAQSVTFNDDAKERGYFDRPYLRYEAEPGRCETNGSFLESTFDQRKVQSEASNQAALQLVVKDSWVQWTNEKPADGLTIRFSLPDGEDGKGLKGTLALYVDDVFIRDITLDSYWAWQYILKTGSKYPDNEPNPSLKFPRMRFDEIHVKLESKISANATIRLVKTDDNDLPYTIDFIEMEEVPEPVTFESFDDENKIQYTPDKGELQYFIADNKGKTIYLPPGRYEVDRRIYITGDNTKIIGAGMWFTEIYFSASSDERSSYNQRGIETSNSDIVLEGLYLNTVNNKRYYNNDSRYQVGKGLMGSFGSNSLIRNVWIEHFECGAWIENSDQLNIRQCRFRNNYADGINLSYGSKNSTVEHCSFRNNGDDDMASWSRADKMCENNVYRFCTSENNWRASSLGFFGGKQNKAYNIVIIDPMEAGFRVTCDFPGMPFSNEGFSEFYNISVYKGGVTAGTPGFSGDLWGNEQGALHINSSSQYDLQNIKIYNVDFYDSKNDAIFIGSNVKNIRNLVLRDIAISGTGRYGIYFYNSKGYGTYCNLHYENIGAANNTNAIPATFNFTEDCSTTSSINFKKETEMNVFSRGGTLYLHGPGNTQVSVFDIYGRKLFQDPLASGHAIVPGLMTGLYIVKWKDNQSMKVFVR